MPTFSAISLSRLSTCDLKLQQILKELIKIWDCQVTEGHRNQIDQDKAYATGKSKLKWPNSKHNAYPSKAVDIVPLPIDWNDRERFFYQAGLIKGIANQLGIKITWGGNWKNDNDFKANKFDDLPHIELVE